MSHSTYKRGFAELLEKKFLAATPSQNLFWLNPSFIWNGDRLAFVKEYRRASSKPRDTLTGDLFEAIA